jgi:phage tail-like protein
MAEDGSKQAATEWPVPKFRFEVTWDSAKISFQEVSGLDVEAQPIEYRAGDSPNFSVTKMPGIKKYTDVTMKKGMFKGDKSFTEWFAGITMNTIKRKAVTISLLDEKASALVIWKLTNAWPTKITGTDLKSTANEVAIETIVIAHDGLEIEVK